MPAWERTYRDVQEMSGLPPLTDAEVERERRIREAATRESSWSAARIEELTRLLHGDGVTPEQAVRLLSAHSRIAKGVSGEAIDVCLAAIWPLVVWPSDLLEAFGTDVLFHPYVERAIQGLSALARDPRTVRSSLDEGEHLKKLVEGMRRTSIDRAFRALQDEREPEGLAQVAKTELARVFAYLTRRSAPTKPRVMRPFRTFVDFQKLTTDWNGEPQLSEHEAVAWIAQKDDRSEAAVRSDVQKARKHLGLRKLPYRRRGPRLGAEAKSVASLFRAVDLENPKKLT